MTDKRARSKKRVFGLCKNFLLIDRIRVLFIKFGLPKILSVVWRDAADFFRMYPKKKSTLMRVEYDDKV